MSTEDVIRLAQALGLQTDSSEAEAVARRLQVIGRSVDEALREQLLPSDEPFAVEQFGGGGERPVAPGRAGPAATPSRPGHAAAQARVRPAATQPQPSARPQQTPTSHDELTSLDVASLAELLAAREVSPVEVTEAYLTRIAAVDGELGSFITVTHERARADAAASEREIMNGDYRGAMHGVPIAHKDLIQTRGIRTTFHTEEYKDFVPDADSDVVTNLDRAGSVLLGKLNTYELGNGVGSVFGPARNPWDLTREAGGSSSGSAAAVAADLAAASTGTDAAGSIRVPAAFCGVVGLKPTFGVIGQRPDPWNSVSTVGPLTKTVRDAAIMLEWMVDSPVVGTAPGVDYRDLVSRLPESVEGLSIGVPRKWLEVPLDAEVEEAFWSAVGWFEETGATVVDVELPHSDWSQTIGSVVTTVEGFARHRTLLAKGSKVSPYVRQTILTAQLIGASDMLLAKTARQVLIAEVRDLHRQVDLIITPTLPYPAYRFDETELTLKGTVVNARANLTVFGRLANLTGFPAVSVPCGFNRAGLPLAFQLMGRPYEEATVLGAAAAYEDDVQPAARRSV